MVVSRRRIPIGPRFSAWCGRSNPTGDPAVLVTKLDRFDLASLRRLCSINEDLLEPYCCNLVAIRDGINTFEPVSKMLCRSWRSSGRSSGKHVERCKATIRHPEQGGLRQSAVWVHEGCRREAWRLVPAPNTHPWLERLVGWYREGVGMSEIARRLNAAG